MFEKKGFFPIEDRDTRLRLIRDASKASSAATLWTKGRSILFRTTISNFDLASGTFRAAIPRELTLEKILSIVGDREGTFFSLELHNSQILFRTKIHNFEENSSFLEFRLPEEVYRTQQRKHPRINTSGNSNVKAFHDDPIHPGRMIRRKVADLSVGGAAIQLFLGEERHYHFNQRINPFQIHLGSNVHSCWAEVKNIRVIVTEGQRTGLVLGIEFRDLSEQSRKHISAYIDRIIITEFGEIYSEKSESEEKKKDEPDSSGGES